MLAIENTLSEKSPSRLEKWWGANGFQRIYKEFRGGTLDPVFMKQIADVRNVSKVFNLRGYQFGNWVTNEDRFNYLAALGICLYDLNKVLKFKSNNMGFDGHLGVAFGARGFKGAVAHYEPWSHVINVTRYKEADDFIGKPSKEVRFVNSGGVGSFAHEYGHFLDYFFGSRYEVDTNVFSLSDGTSIDRKRKNYNKSKQPLRYAMEDILEVAYWGSPVKKEKSAYIKRIEGFSDKDYYVQRCEIFARLFEQYIGHKLIQLKVENKFLTKTKYNTAIYMTDAELKKVIPLFDNLLVLMRMAF